MNEETFLEAGWSIIGNGKSRPVAFSSEVWESWTDHFGAMPAVILELWIRLTGLHDFIEGTRPLHLMWSLYILRVYALENINKTVLKADRQTIRRWTWPIIKSIANLSLDLIDFERRKEGQTPVANHYVYVDCTVCATTEERKPFSSGWSAKKLGKKPGLLYELATCIATGFIVWTNGPYPAGDWTDIKVFDRHLILELEEGEKVLGDTGYQGRDIYATVTGRLERDPILKRIKARHEQVNGWMKKWKVLSERFRHDKQLHYRCYQAIAVITQIEMETGYKIAYPIVAP